MRIRTRLSGICGSDLATIRAKGSPYFSPLTSCPFVFGHEVVGEVAAAGEGATGVSVGDRVVIEPALCCVVRGIEPVCAPCARGAYGNCENVLHGDLAPGIQTGYCRDTGGGWSAEFVAHPFQVHPAPATLSDEEAVLVEPFSCCLHAALQANPPDEATVLVLGCGTIGLLTIAALRAAGSRCRILAAARYPHQQEMARVLGADVVIGRERSLYDAVCAETGATRHQPEIGRPTFIGGVSMTFDCVGSGRTIDDALRVTAGQGTVMIVGMPGIPSGIDWTAVWYKELRVLGAYAYGTETWRGERIRTFALALRLLARGDTPLKPLVTHRFPLDQYRQALAHALLAGRSGAVKVAFDFRG
jgi:threonine dehydrogenase-like Zn-dependent dehydrogenase